MIVEQLGMFAGSLVSILKALETIVNDHGDANLDTKMSLHDSKLDILDTLIMLSTALESHAALRELKLYHGSIVLAPRFFNGSMCLDFAIITEVNKAFQELDAHESFDQHNKNLVLTYQTTEAINEIQSSVYNIAWLRPQSNYELVAHEISFTGTTIPSKHTHI